jgi:hypothetical protein
MTTDTTIVEFRVVCANYGGRADHRTHCWVKGSAGKAEQSRIDADHHASLHPDLWWRNEAPYRVQVRSVSDWHDHAPMLDESMVSP